MDRHTKPTYRMGPCRLLLVLTLSLLAGSLGAVTVADLYQASQPPVGSSRDAAFAEALKTVAVRVSGQRDAATRLSASALANPRQYAQRIAFAADGTLDVTFDSASVDRILSAAGLPIWGRERPTTVLLVSIEDPSGSSHWLSLDSPAAEREVLVRAARLRGLPIVWPDRAQVGALSDTNPASLLQAAARHGANATLLGRAQRDGAGGFQTRWTLVSEEVSSEATGTLEDGIHLAADSFARVFAASGSTIDSVALEVAGIGDLKAYAATLNYLEGLTVVRAVAVEQVSGDTMRFRIAVRGDRETLRRAISLDTRLAPLDASGAPGDRLAFRYRP
jgi:hypothetical protein